MSDGAAAAGDTQAAEDGRTRVNRNSRDREKWRWWLIDKLGKLPGFCWSDLVMWAITGPEPRDRYTRWPCRREGYTLRNAYHAATCRTDANKHPDPVHRCCYCGKVGASSPGEGCDLVVSS